MIKLLVLRGSRWIIIISLSSKERKGIHLNLDKIKSKMPLFSFLHSFLSLEVVNIFSVSDSESLFLGFLLSLSPDPFFYSDIINFFELSKEQEI